jgi:hypothetical protein
MCLLKYVLNCEQNFSFFIFRAGLSDIRINCNQISEGLLYEKSWNNIKIYLLFILHAFYNDAVTITTYMASNIWIIVNNKRGILWKKAVGAYFKK